MSRSSPRVLIGVLSGLMIGAVGTLAVAVWAIGAIVNGYALPYLMGAIAAVALGTFLFLVLLTMGVLYRVDRLNRDVERRVSLFE